MTPLSVPFVGLPDLNAWVGFLRLIFPIIREGRLKSARAAYDFFRSENKRIYGSDNSPQFSDDGYQFDWFVKDMEPMRKIFMKPRSDPSFNQTVATQAIQRGVARATENGGREAMQHAVEVTQNEPEPDPPKTTKEIVEEALAEPEPKPEKKRKGKKEKPPKILDYKGNVVKMKPRRVKGWARVPTGAETCGWCLTMCSRGPVYTSAYTAGLELEDYQAVYDYNSGQEIEDDDMNQWHPGCDCKVVPVFDTRDWPGRDQSLEYLEMWKEATRLAEAELEANPGKKSLVGGKWVKTTLNREALNQMRRLAGEYEKKRLRQAA